MTRRFSVHLICRRVEDYHFNSSLTTMSPYARSGIVVATDAGVKVAEEDAHDRSNGFTEFLVESLFCSLQSLYHV